jgi:hypothetical protein
LLGFKKPRKKSAKSRKLGFLRNDCGGESRKPMKNQGENQGSRKPSVLVFLVGFLRQKKDCAMCIVHTPSDS